MMDVKEFVEADFLHPQLPLVIFPRVAGWQAAISL